VSELQTEQAQCYFLPYYMGKEYDLDAIRIILYDYGSERGRLIIECFGDAYSHYWGAMGAATVRQFVSRCHEDYLVDKLMPDYLNQRQCKLREVHLRRIVRRVQEALREVT